MGSEPSRDPQAVCDSAPIEDGPGRAAAEPVGKVRFSAAGTHYFDRFSGLNVLLETAQVSAEQWSVAPRYASIALTNACELSCPYCYAPKHHAGLRADDVIRWATELDAAGCFGVGFGGGEPTLHPQFVDICTTIASTTSLAVTFTTHGHRITQRLVEALRGSVHFVRVSVDGVGAVYETLRGRSFEAVQRAVELVASFTPFGINVVVNADTVGQLDDIVSFAANCGATEVLLLPEQPTPSRPGLGDPDRDGLVNWVLRSSAPIRLTIARSGLESSLPTADPFPGEDPLSAHVHIDASGFLRPNAYSGPAVPVGQSVLRAVGTLRGTA